VSNKWKARLGVLTLALVAGMGCNPILLTAYLFNGAEDPKNPAEFPLKPRPKHEKDEVRVVVLTSCVPGISTDMIGVDRLLAAELIPMLEAKCVENKEKIKVLKSAPIDTYKKDNPDWRKQHPMDIGQHFNADYVIDIEVLDISIYEPGTSRRLMRGRSKVAVAAYDMSSKLRDPAFNPPEFNFTYPRGHEVSVDEVPASTFRQKFVKRIASDLVIQFTAHKSDTKVPVD
jgi:hypothetical protein